MYFKQFCKERNIKPETIKSYQTAINHYTRYHSMSLDDLIGEAIMEENDGEITKRERNIKKRLYQFRIYQLEKTDLKTSTVISNMGRINALYSHFDIELPKLPPLKSDKEFEITYNDLPSKKQIAMAVWISGIRVASLILFMASSGVGRVECANMTVGDFIDACSQYHTKNTLPEILEELYKSRENIVPTFYIYREKTKKKYFTFSTPEATQAIVKWLMIRLEICRENGEELKMEDSLWDWTTRQITYRFSIINDELGFGFKGTYRSLRPHMLRKFHASNIGLSRDDIDLLQGRSRGVVYESYIKANPKTLKKRYMDVMENVTISKIDKKTRRDEFTININLNFYGNEYGVTL